MIYLASPYSHELEHIRIRRYLLARDFCHLEMRKGIEIFSPIVYGHQFAYDLGYGEDAATWQSFNFEMLLACREMWILTIPGWEESFGVALERNQAKNALIPIFLKEPPAYATL